MPAENVTLLSTRIHGRCHLPEGYAFTVVPSDAKFKDDPEPVTAETANPGSDFELLNRLRFSTHLQQHQSTSDIYDISIIVSAFPSVIYRR
jgi:hypothetical protein